MLTPRLFPHILRIFQVLQDWLQKIMSKQGKYSTLEERNAYKREWRRKRRTDPEYRDREQAYNRNLRSRPGGRDFQIEYRSKPEHKAKQRGYLLKRNHGLTVEQWERMFNEQGRICGICKSLEPTTIHGWHVDHCHLTNKIRGILCHSCNTAIGLFKDNIESLLSAVKYLKSS